MAEWLFERGIGEDRAILVDGGTIIEAAIDLPTALRAGAVVGGRLAAILIPGRRGMVETAHGMVLAEPLPQQFTEGQALRVEVVREAASEAGRLKHAKGRITGAQEQEGASLAERIGPARAVPPLGRDLFEEAGWSELLEEAATGRIVFPGGELRMSVTPAMTLFDVDGTLPSAELALAGAKAAARAIRRLAIGGSIGIDLPTVAGKAERQQAAEAVDALLPQPFERTAVNGFGFLQIVRRRTRPSIPEIVQSDPIGAAARALLRRAERESGAGSLQLMAAPPVVARIESRAEWVAELERRTGRPVALRAEPGLTTWGGHVHAAASA